MFKHKKSSKTQGVVYATQTGQLLPLESMPDEIIAQGILGNGLCILPQKDEVFSPVSGLISTITDSKHAFGIIAEDGAEIIVHIGVDTVEMHGNGFNTHVIVGQSVKAGELLCSVDRSLIQEAGYALHTAILITNSDKFVILECPHAHAVIEKDKIFEYQPIEDV